MNVRHDVLRVVVPYVIVTALWIYLSDDVVRRLAGDVSTSAHWSTLKGFFFIAVTATLLWILLTQRLRRLADAQRDLARERTRLRTVLDTIPDLVWLKNAEGKYVACNQAFERFAGVPESGLVGKDDFAFFDHHLAQFFREHDAAAAKAGRPTMNEERVTYRSDGTVHDLETIKTPMPDDVERGTVGVLGIARDVTESRRTAEELRETARQFQLALGAAELGTWRHDLSTGRIWFDERARLQHGIDRAEMDLGEIFDLVHPDDHAAVATGIQQSLNLLTGGSSTVVYRAHRRDGGFRWLRVVVGVVFEGTGMDRRAARAYGITQDISDSRLAEERLREQETVLREAGAIAHVGGWQFDVATGRGTWSEEVAKIHDLDAIASPGVAGGLVFYPGHSRERIEAAVKAAIERGEPYDLELEFISATGVHKWVRTIGRPVFDQGKVVRLVGAIQDITDRHRAEEAIQRFVKGSPAVIYALDAREGRVLWAGGNVEEMTGWEQSDVAAEWWMQGIHPDDAARVMSQSVVPFTFDHQILEYRFRRRSGEYFWVRDEKRLLRDAQGRPMEVVGSWSDVTERVQLEEQLRQSQKLEAIGSLAGGVAHDFNNILTIVAGNSDLLAERLAPGTIERSLLTEIRDAGERAAALTRQLLAFSRSQVLAPEVISLNDAVRRIETMLRRLIGEHIELQCELSPTTGHVRVDPGQLEQVILNLAVNARDAMPQGGRLTISTGRVELDDTYCRQHSGATPGEHAALTISDSGLGMSREVKARVFEPFFTTKGPGKGTGLGLATVFGIVKQSGGHIEVESEMGSGTSFRIFFPSVDEVPSPAVAEPPGDITRGHETVLLVEDEDGVRKVARLALESRGYKVIGAADGVAALALMEQYKDVALLITDLVMPQMSGRELADLLRSRRPGLKVLFMSGYVDDALVREGLAEAPEAFIQKPFALSDLAERVRELLDG